MRIKKPVQNFIVDVANLAAFVLMIVTGLLMRYKLPPGSGRGATLLGLSRHEWGSVHFWISIAVLILLSVHLILHWKWIASMVRGRQLERSKRRTVFALGGLIGFVALAGSVLLLPVQQAGDESKHLRSRSGRTETPVEVRPSTQVEPAHEISSVRGNVTDRKTRALKNKQQ